MAEGRRSPWALIIAALVGLALIFGVRAWTGRETGPTNVASAGVDASCQVITVVASSEKAALLGTMAADYNGQRRTVGAGCAQVTVVSKASGGAEAALARGWDDTTDGPRPDVWTPASSSWAGLLQQGLASNDTPNIVPKDLPSIAQTPLVVAMPRPMAEALGWPAKEIGWGDLLTLSKNPKGWGAYGHPEWGKFKLGKTNPHYSTSGLNATVAAYFAATGVSSDLTSAQVADPAVQAYVKSIEQSVVHYGDTTLTFLDNMSRAAAAGKGLTYVSAVTVEEKSVLDYNSGNPTGDPAKAGQAPPPAVPLVAVYPKEGTLLSDNPWIVLDASWVDAPKKAVAADFLSFVREPAQQQRFQAAGFRSFEGVAGDPLTEANGMLVNQPAVVLAPPAPAVLEQVQKSWDSLRKGARVLVILDVSGSMGEPVPDAGKSKLDLAKEAAEQAVQGFAPNDELGLWLFSTGLGTGGEPYLKSVPIGPVTTTLPQVTSTIRGLVPDGGTGLYATLRAAQQEMTASLDTTRINAIVLLTDGRNEYPPDTDLKGLLRQLGGESLDTSVRVFPIAYGEGADTEALKQIAESSRAAFYDASDPATIGKVLTSVLSNF